MSQSNNQKAQDLFCAKRHYNTLSEVHEQAAITFNDMVILASGKASTRHTQIFQQLNQSLPLRRQYMNLVKQFAYDVSASQAAASEETELEKRVSKQFSLEFLRDPIHNNQVYAIINIDVPTQGQCEGEFKITVSTSDALYEVNFPALIDKRSQRLFDTNDPALLALADPLSTIVISK